MNSTPEAPRRMTRVATRSAQLATVHIQAHQLGLETRAAFDRTEYENILMAVAGVRSLRRANRQQREAVIAFLGECVAEHDARTRHVPEYVSDAEFLSVLA